MGELIVFQSPTRCDEQVVGRLTDKPFEYQVAAEMLDILGDDFHIFFCRIEMKRRLGILGGHTGGTDDLQLVYLENVKRQRRDDVGLADTLCDIFARQTDDDVTAREQPTPMASLYRIAATGEVVAAVDAAQGGIVGRLDAVLYEHKAVLGQFAEIVEQTVVYAVGTRADDDADHILDGERFLIKTAQTVGGGIGIGEGLKIGEKLHVGIFAGKEPLALFQLLGDRFAGVAVGWVERAVVAVGASAEGNAAVAVGTGKACIDGYLLYLEGELLA